MGRTRLFIILGGVVVVICVLFSIVFLGERARARDAIRLRDMRHIEQQYQQAFLATGSFRTAQLPDVADPGASAYVVEPATDTTFRVRFRLEGAYDGLSKGERTMSEKGIQ